jgi:MYXO-CTERM domain-containing protein
MKKVVLMAGVASLIAGTAYADYTADWSVNEDGWTTSGGDPWVFTAGVDWFAVDDSTGPDSGFLTSPTFVVDEGAVTFNFDHDYIMETGYDGGVVEISVNGAPAAYYAMGDYDTTISTGFGSAIGGLLAYSGDSLAPINSASGDLVVDLGLVAGDEIVISFHQADDSSVGEVGWSMIGFEIDGASVIPAPGALALLGLAGLARTRRRR